MTLAAGREAYQKLQDAFGVVCARSDHLGQDYDWAGGPYSFAVSQGYVNTHVLGSLKKISLYCGDEANVVRLLLAAEGVPVRMVCFHYTTTGADLWGHQAGEALIPHYGWTFFDSYWGVIAKPGKNGHDYFLKANGLDDNGAPSGVAPGPALDALTDSLHNTYTPSHYTLFNRACGPCVSGWGQSMKMHRPTEYALPPCPPIEWMTAPALRAAHYFGALP